MKTKNIKTIQLGVEPTALDLTPDGGLVAVSLESLNRRAPTEVYDVRHGNSVGAFGRGLVGRGVAFADEGRTLFHVFERDDQFVFARTEVATGRTTELARYEPGHFCRELSRDERGAFVAVCGDMAEVWDTAKGARLFSASPFRPRTPVQLAFDRPGERLWLWGTVKGQFVELDTAGFAERSRLRAPAPAGAQLALSPSGRRLVAVAEGVVGVFLYDLEARKRLLPRRYGKMTYSGRFAFSQDDEHLVNLIGSGVIIDHLATTEFADVPVRGDGAAVLAVADRVPLVAASWRDGALSSFEWSDDPDE